MQSTLSRLYARVGPIVGALYLYLIAVIMLGGATVGIQYAGHGPQLHAMWLLLYGGLTTIVAATLLLRGRTVGTLVIYCASILVLLIIFARAHAAFDGYGDTTFDVPSWPPILLNILIATAIGAPAVFSMFSQRQTVKSFAQLFPTWASRFSALLLLLILAAAFGPGAIAHQYSSSRIVGQWMVSFGGQSQGVIFGADGSYTDLRNGQVVMTGKWVRDGSSSADVTINGVTGHYSLSQGDQLCFESPDTASVCYDRVSQ